MPQKNKAPRVGDNNKTEIKTESKERKKLSKKAFVAIACICVALIVLSIALPIGLIYGLKTSTVPEPYFYNFNDESDFFINVRWNKIRNADAYEYQYRYSYKDVYDEEITVESDVIRVGSDKTRTSFNRHKGLVTFRIRAIIDKEIKDWSDWISLNVSAWQIEKPIVTLNEKLEMSWASSTFKLKDGLHEIEGYLVNVYIDDEPMYYPEDFYSKARSVSAKNYCIQTIKDSEKVSNYSLYGEWEDIVIELKVKALNYTEYQGIKIKNFIDETDPNKFLLDLYEDSEYGVAKITITEDIYKQLTE